MANNLLDLEKKTRQVELWDTANPASVVNLLSPGASDKIKNCAIVKPDLFNIQDEHTLYQHLSKIKAKPTPTDNRLRLAFWLEYDRVCNGFKDRIEMVNVYAGVCTHAYFENKYLKIPEKVAWLLTPPASYEVVLEEALQFGIEQLRETLSLPHLKDNGEIDVKMIELKAKIFAMLDMRKHGMYTQKIKQESLNINVTDATKLATQVGGKTLDQTMQMLEDKIRELEKRDKSRQALPDIPVESVNDANTPKE